MSNKISDGGPAFPADFQLYSTGMTLRDYFAAAALQGILALDKDGTWDEFSKCSYRIADAMIKAREAKP